MNKKKIIIPLVILLFLLGILTNIVSDQDNSETISLAEVNHIENEIDLEKPKTAAYQTYYNLWIDDSAAFGNGTWNDIDAAYTWCTWMGSYYLIEDITLNNLDNTGRPLRIENSEVDFIIKNCTFSNSGDHAGIYLDDAHNGDFYDCNISDCIYGIYITASSSNNTFTNIRIDSVSTYGICILSNSDNNDFTDCTITDYALSGIYCTTDGCMFENNTIEGGQTGIWVDTAQDTIIRNNTITDCSLYGGIFYHDSNNIEISDNTMQNCGINFADDTNYNNLNTTTIYMNNTVNGKPIYFYKNQEHLNTNNFTYAGQPGQIILFNCNYSTILNFDISYATLGIYLAYSSHNIVCNNSLRNNYHGIRLFYYCDNNTIINNTIKDSIWRNLQLLYYNDDNTIVNNTISGGSHGIDLTSYNNDNEITKNRVIDNGDITTNSAGVLIFQSDYNNITHNIAKGNQRAIYIQSDSDHNLVYNNTCIDNVVSGIVIVDECNDNMILENICSETIVGEIQDWGIYVFDECQWNNIIGNEIESNTQDGIYIDKNCAYNNISLNDIKLNLNDGIHLYSNSENNTIFKNNISQNNEYGIYIEDSCENNTILENNLRNNGYSGINISQSNDNVIIKNDIIENGYASGFHGGISLDNAHYTNITKNTIQNNQDFGIYIYESDNNEILNNTIKENTYGIFIDGAGADSSNNIIYLNNFTNNSYHALDDGTLNMWDNGTIGNSWDNYTGKDANDDGIGDTEHKVYGAINDSKPIYWDAPVISLLSPFNESIHQTIPTFSISLLEGINQTMWYTINSSIVKYYFFNLTSTLDVVLWESLSNCTLILHFFVSDSRGFFTNIDLNITIGKINTQQITNPTISDSNGDDDDDSEETGVDFFVIIIVLIATITAGISVVYILIHKGIIGGKKQALIQKKSVAREEKRIPPKLPKSPIKDGKLKKEIPPVAVITEAEKKEIEKTEAEIDLEKKEFICVVHRGAITGRLYVCPSCQTVYCEKCAKALEKKAEKCWSCNNKIEL